MSKLASTSTANNDSQNTTSCRFVIENFQKTTGFNDKHFQLSSNDKINLRLVVNINAWSACTFIYVLATTSEQSTEQVRCCLSILDKDDKKRVVSDGLTVFGKDGPKCWPQITIYQKELLDPANGFLQNGSLVVNCEVNYFPRNSDFPSANYDHEYEKVSSDLRCLLEESKLSDVALVVNGKELKAHKNILAARSPYFCAMFTGDFQEKTQNCVEITDVDLDVLEELLFYIYTGKIPPLEKFAFDMFIAADKYQLESLKRNCERYIVCSTVLTIDTLPKTLLFADMHNFVELKSKCVDFFVNNSVNVMATEGWKELVTQRADLAIEILQKLAQKAHPLIEKYNKN